MDPPLTKNVLGIETQLDSGPLPSIRMEHGSSLWREASLKPRVFKPLYAASSKHDLSFPVSSPVVSSAPFDSSASIAKLKS
jgi:hypothetical protein